MGATDIFSRDRVLGVKEEHTEAVAKTRSYPYTEAEVSQILHRSLSEVVS